MNSIANETPRKLLAERLQSILAEGRQIKLLFVCLGNICRSPAAEAVMLATIDRFNQNSLWDIDSAGTGDYHIGDLADPRMRQHAGKRGIKLLHRARQVGVSDFYDFDVIIGMDNLNIRNLRAISPTVVTDSKIIAMADFLPGGRLAPTTVDTTSSNGVMHLGEFDGYDHIPDPYYSGAEGFELVLDMLEAGCTNIATLLS